MSQGHLTLGEIIETATLIEEHVICTPVCDWPGAVGACGWMRPQ